MVIMSLATDPFDLNRFVDVQRRDYIVALDELTQGLKRSHWMWYIFPQIQGLGYSYIAQKYAIRNTKESLAYLAHPVLGNRLVRCCEVLLSLDGDPLAYDIFGHPDDLKLKSSMTLFASVSEGDSVFQQVIDSYFNGDSDDRTIDILKK